MFKILYAIVLTIFTFTAISAFSVDTKTAINTKSPPKKTTSEDKAKQLVDQKTLLVTDKQLEEIIDKLSTAERDAIIKIQKEIADWPKSIFDEISSYREFVITARKIAAEKYSKLTPEARQALDREKSLKAQLSPATIKFLETVQLRAVNKTN